MLQQGYSRPAHKQQEGAHVKQHRHYLHMGSLEWLDSNWVSPPNGVAKNTGVLQFEGAQIVDNWATDPISGIAAFLLAFWLQFQGAFEKNKPGS